MILRKVIFLIAFYAAFGKVHAFWGEEFMNEVIQRFKKDTGTCEVPKTPLKKVPKPNVLCDENQFMMQLARLYIISPERIVLLLTRRSLQDTCADVHEVLHRINNTITTCIPLPSDNLYMRLITGLRYFNTQVCQKLHGAESAKKYKDFSNYHNCIRELRDDLIDCEGPADWYEKTNQSIVCPFYNDIADCHYIKAAMLCGLKPALLLRTFTIEIMKRTVPFKCKVSRSLPHVDDPMPAAANSLSFKYLLYFTIALCVSLCTKYG